MDKKVSAKVLLEKLKHLMTATEKQAIEEELKKEEQLQEEADSNIGEQTETQDNPVIEEIFSKNTNGGENKENSTVNEEAVNKKPKLTLVEKGQPIPDFIQEQDKSEEAETDKDTESQYSQPVSEETEENVQEEAEQSSKEVTSESEAKEEKEAVGENRTSEEKTEESDEKEENKKKKEEKEEKKSGQKEIKAKRHKKISLKALFQTAVVIGQVLNSKPDEYADDTEDTENTEEATNTEIKEAASNESKSESLQEVVEVNKLITEQDKQDRLEAAQKANADTEAVPEEEENKFVKVKQSKGNIVIDGDSLPMYAYEDKSPRINVEIGKLSPVLLSAYEAYVEPQELEAIKAQNKDYEATPIEIITQATTSFSKKEVQNTLNKIKEKEEIQELEEFENESNNTEDIREEEEKTAKKAPKEQKPKKSIKEKLFGEYAEEIDYSAFKTPGEEETETIDDYEGPGDIKAIRAEINLNIRKLFFRSLTMGIIFVIMLIITMIQRFFPYALVSTVPNVDIMFCIINLLLLIVGVVVSSVTIKNGFTPLLSFRGNSDTAVAVAAVAALIQCVVSFFDSRAFFMGWQSLYSLLVIFALAINSVGKMLIVIRIKDNFKFVAADRRKYAVKILNDEKVAGEMIDGTNAEEPVVAFQRRTKFLKNFLRLSYAPDPSEKIASKFAPICVMVAIIVAIIHCIVYKSVSGAVSSLALVACMGIPVCSLLSVNIPMRILCKDALKNDCMIVGYQAVKQFCDTNAVMVDSREIYPRTSVELVSVKPFISYDLEKAVLNAAAVMKIANSSMTYVFEDIIRGNDGNLPEVESVKYEEGKGLVGWVEGERILIGNRELLVKYGVEPPSADFEEPYLLEDKQITYLANAGQLIAMFVTAYTPDMKIMREIQRLDANGVSILVRTADANITEERISTDFALHNRSVKILSNSLGNICKDELSVKEEESRAYISTRGKFYSFARAVAGCIKMRGNIALAIAVQIIAVVLGIVIASLVAVLAGVEGLGSLEILLYMIFWAAASVLVPLIQRP